MREREREELRDKIEDTELKIIKLYNLYNFISFNMAFTEKHYHHIVHKITYKEEKKRKNIKVI